MPKFQSVWQRCCCYAGGVTCFLSITCYVILHFSVFVIFLEEMKSLIDRLRSTQQNNVIFISYCDVIDVAAILAAILNFI